MNETVKRLFKENADKIVISSPFGNRKDPITGAVNMFHDGTDYAPRPAGTKYPTYSVESGTVHSCGTDGTGGKYVWVKYPHIGKAGVYYHLDSIAVVKGQTLRLGDKIGNIGTTGRSTGVHLHFGWCDLAAFSSAWNKNKWQDFEKYFTGGASMGNEIKGIDVSSHQGSIDWAAVKASGVEFAIIRVGYTWYEGGLTVDTYFAKNMQLAIAAGINVGVYAYAYDTSPDAARKSAAAVLAAIKPYKLTMPVFYDQEYEECIKKLDKQRRTDNCKAFLQAVEAAGYYAGLYASKDWLENWVFGDQLAAYDKWVAQYGTQCTYSQPFGMWQYAGSTGTCPGVKGACDRNYAYKNYPDIIRKAGLNHLTGEQPTPPTTEEKPQQPTSEQYEAALARIAALEQMLAERTQQFAEAESCIEKITSCVHTYAEIYGGNKT